MLHKAFCCVSKCLLLNHCMCVSVCAFMYVNVKIIKICTSRKTNYLRPLWNS